LVTVPLIETSTDYSDRKRKWLLLGLAIMAVLLVGLLLIHFFVIELDLLFYTLTSKLARL
jgi:hypothetical protein